MSEESNYVVPLKSTYPTLGSLPDPNPTGQSYLQIKLPGKPTIRGILKRKLDLLLLDQLRSKILNFYEIKV